MRILQTLQRVHAMAAVDQNSVKNFIYCAYVIVCSLKSEAKGKILNLPNDVKQKVSIANATSPALFRRYGTSIRSWNRALSFVVENSYVPQETTAQLGADLKVFLKAAMSDNTYPDLALTITRAFGTYLRMRSDASLKMLNSKVGFNKDSFLSKNFLGEGVDVNNHSKQSNDLKDLVKKLTGKTGDYLNPKQAQQVKEANPTGYADYYSKYKKLSGDTKQYLMDTLRAAGKPFIRYDAFKLRCKNNGMLCTLPDGFEGYLDEVGNFYSLNKKLIAGKPTSKVTMNSKYNPTTDDTYVFTTPSPTKDDAIMYFYTVASKNHNEKTKYAKADLLIKELPKIRKKWLKDLAKANTNVSYYACIIELIYKFAARIGTTGNMNAGQPTFGLSTIEVKHVKRQGTRFIFQYPGKKGTMQNHKLIPNDVPSRRCADIIAHEMQNKKPSDLLWTFRNKPITGAMLRNYWKKLDPVCEQASIHKLRTAEATLLAWEIMKNSPFTKGAKQQEVEKWYKEQMLAVGKKLAHQTGNKDTSTTAIKSYIDLDTQQEFFTKLGLRIPTWLRRTKDDD